MVPIEVPKQFHSCCKMRRKVIISEGGVMTVNRAHDYTNLYQIRIYHINKYVKTVLKACRNHIKRINTHTHIVHTYTPTITPHSTHI